MSQTTAKVNSLKEIQLKYKSALDDTNALICQQLESLAPQSDKLIETLNASRGKQLRPLFCYSIFNGFGASTDKASSLAAVFESVHIASLLHDDVIDKCRLRRNLPTMNKLFGDGVAILLGDLVFVAIYELAASLDELWLVSDISKTIKLLVEGELLQQQYRFKEETSIEDYESVIYRKTAALLELCCYASARFSGQEERVCEEFKKFGSYFGSIFQMVDDWADFCKACQKDNKDRGVDIANGFITLPWLILLDQCTPSEKESLTAIINEGMPAGLNNSEVESLAEKYDLNSLMIAKLESYKKKAEEALDAVPNFDSIELKTFLNFILIEFMKISESK